MHFTELKHDHRYQEYTMEDPVPMEDVSLESLSHDV